MSSQLPPPSEVPESEWQIVIGSNILPVKRHPAGALETDQVRKRNLGVWLNSTSGDDIVEDADGNTTPFRAFKTLLPPNNISKELVNFFTKVYNTRAIPGRVGLPYGGLATSSGSFQEFIRPYNDASDGSQPNMIVCPFDLETATICVVLFPKDSVVITYDWTSGTGLTEGILKVRNYLPIFCETTSSLTTSQQLRDSFPDVSWMSGTAEIRPAEIAASKRESTLRYLEFLCQEITGSRGMAKPSNPRASRTIDSILEGVAVEAFTQVLREEWRVVPAMFFKIADSGAAAASSSTPE